MILAFFLIYIFSMFLYPWFDKEWNWQHVQNVWDRWQGLNVGMLAFISSVIAFSISKYHVEKQREREFMAVRSYLPLSLSELQEYLYSSSAILRSAWESLSAKKLPEFNPIYLPKESILIFENCIKLGDTEIGDHLSKILTKLQVFNSRINSIKQSKSNETQTFINYMTSTTHRNLLVYFYNLGEITSMVAKSYAIGRGKDDLNLSNPVWEDFINAYQQLDIVPENYIADKDSLETLTKRLIKKP